MILIFILKIGSCKKRAKLCYHNSKISLASSVPKKDYITQDILLAKSVPNFITITQASSPPRGHKVSGQKLSSHIDKRLQTGHIIDVGWFDTHFFFFTGGLMALHENRYFTELEWATIDDALDALINDILESAEPEFAQSLENVVLAYGLDECMKEELVRQYDWLDAQQCYSNR